MKLSTVILLAALANDPKSPDLPTCPLCGALKYASRECRNCGTYRCSTCDRFHIGDPDQACNGKGVAL